MLTIQNIKKLSLDEIYIVTRKHIDLSGAFDNTRKREIVIKRQILHRLAKWYSGATLEQIGQRYGSRDHATVLHSCKVVDNLYETDRSMRWVVDQICKELNYLATDEIDIIQMCLNASSYDIRRLA
jgi:chromosomal replication initiator protein